MTRRRGMRPSAKRYGLLGFIALSTPLLFAIEAAIRRVVAPEALDTLAHLLGPHVGPYAWAMPLLAGIGTLLGLKFRAWYAKRESARRPNVDPARLEFDALMLATSIPQVPALAAVCLFVLGASVHPAWITVAVATLGVLAIGFFGPHLPTGHSS